MALLLCQEHTVGFENLFAALPTAPQEEPEWVDPLPIWGASKIAEREGHGYELPHRLTISETTGWLKSFLTEFTKTNNF